MRSNLSLMFALALSTAAVGCTEQDASEVFDDESPSLETEGTHGSGGTNGLGEEDYLTYRYHVGYVAMKYPFLVNNNTMVNPNIISSSSPAGWFRVFSYMFACVVPDGGTWTLNGVTFTGRGHLKTGTEWYGAPLSPARAQQLVACVTAHVNPYHLQVPIHLSGPQIKDDSGILFYYPVEEALWTVKFGVDFVPTITAYPATPLVTSCGENVYQAIKNRVCGQSPESCNLTVGNMDSCTFVTGQGYSCNGQPAILTRLMQSGYDSLYSTCGAPAL